MSIRIVKLTRTDRNPKFSYCSNVEKEYLNGTDTDQYYAWEKFMNDYLAGKSLPEYVQVEKDITEYVGRCVETETAYDVRIMSDVWENQTFMKIWAPERIGQKYSEYNDNLVESPIPHEFLYGSDGRHPSERVIAKVDASMAVRVDYRIAKEAEEEKRAAEMLAQEEASAKALVEWETKQVRIGKTVVVNRGRKVAKNTVGKCFWMGQDSFGKGKCGIAITERKDERGRYTDVVWTATSNCDPVG